MSYSVSFVIRGSKGLTRVFRDGKDLEVAERVPDIVKSLRTSKPAGRASEPAGRGLDPVKRASKQARRASEAVGRALDPAK